MRPFNFSFGVEIYGITVYVYVGYECEKALYLVGRRIDADLDINSLGLLEGGSFVSGCLGGIYLSGDYTRITPELAGLIAHECRHLSDQILELCGCSDEGALSHEYSVLLLEYLVKTVTQKLERRLLNQVAKKGKRKSAEPVSRAAKPKRKPRKRRS